MSTQQGSESMHRGIEEVENIIKQIRFPTVTREYIILSVISSMLG